VKYYEGAHASRRGVSHFQSDAIPNWPHLREVENASQRYDCIEVNGVESVCFIAADRHEADRYWVVRDSDSHLYHEVYAEQGTGEEGELELLEPNTFADIAEEEHDEQASSSSSSGSEDGEADESGNESELSEDLALVQPSLAAEIARDRDRWGDDMYN
jgi:hypothetical protein